MTKLEETMKAHPEMDPFSITRIELKKVADPSLRGGLEAVADLLQLVAGALDDAEPKPAPETPSHAGYPGDAPPAT